MRPSTERTFGRDRGAPGSKTPSGGRFENLKIFEKIFYFRFLGALTTTGRQGVPVPETRLSPLGGTVWQLGPPKMPFLQITIGGFSESPRFIFDLSPMWIPCPPGHFLQYSEWGVRGSEHPRNRPRRNSRFFAPTFDPLGVLPQKFWL